MTPAEFSEQRVSSVRVENGLEFPYTDRFDGVPVTIPAGGSQIIPAEMAAHFFGWHPDVENETMFRHMCKRQGWNTPAFVQQNPDTQKTLAREYFERMIIAPVSYKLVEDVQPDPKKPVPAEPDDEPQTFKARNAKRWSQGNQETA